MNNEEKKIEEEQLPSESETIKELLNKIEILEKEKNEYLESLKRAKSDVLKIQKEFEEKSNEIKELANFELIYHLINVLDSFDLAFKKNDKIDQGFYLIYSQLKDILEKFGLEEIISDNMKFNPHFHEVLTSKKCEKENCQGEDEGLIIETLSKGYLYKNKLLRPARVKIITH
jgi:molecular chaperone GrpE